MVDTYEFSITRFPHTLLFLQDGCVNICESGGRGVTSKGQEWLYKLFWPISHTIRLNYCSKNLNNKIKFKCISTDISNISKFHSRKFTMNIPLPSLCQVHIKDTITKTLSYASCCYFFYHPVVGKGCLRGKAPKTNLYKQSETSLI